MNERIRVRIGTAGSPVTAESLFGWATHDTENGYGDEGGYTVEWDDGWLDHPTVRYFFDDRVFNSIHEVPENAAEEALV